MSDSLIEKRQKQREFLLQKIYDASDGSTTKWIDFANLAESMGLEQADARNALDYLEERKFIWATDDGWHGKIEHEGIKAYERLKTEPLKPSHQTNIVRIEGNANAPIQVGGHGNVQNVSYSSNNAAGDALVKIIEAVKASQLDEHDKADAIHNLQQVQKLSQQEKTPDRIEKAKKYFDFAQSIIKSGTELAKNTAQYWPAIAQHFGWIVQ